MKRSNSLATLFPFLDWWPRVDRASLRADALAGLLGAIIVVPQGVAFATLAGMPPQYGLYLAVVPTIVAALWGSSWHAVSGPTNAVSLFVYATLAPLAVPGSAEYIGHALTLSLMCGVLMVSLGIARLGVLVNFVSHTVVVGFTAGAGLLIFASQLRGFFGIDLDRGLPFVLKIGQFALRVGETNLWVLAVSGATLAAGVLGRKVMPKIPPLLTALIVGCLVGFALNHWFGEAHTGITTLGALPSPLPVLSLPDVSPPHLRELAGIAVGITVLSLTEALSIARAIALRSGQRIDANREFIGQGLSNIAAAFFSGYPSSASFNRSGINYDAGARTPLAAVLAALFLVLLLVLLAPLVAYIPLATMSAILFLVAWGLIDRAAIRSIAHASRSEAGVLVITLVATLTLSLEVAVLVGVLASLAIYLMRTSRPAMRSLVPDPRHAKRKLSELAPGLAECPQTKLLRVEGSLYFGAVDHVEHHFETLRAVHPERKHLLVMAKSINFVDVAGAELLRREAERRRAAGGALYLYSPRQPVREMLERGGYLEPIGKERIFFSKDEAIRGVVAQLDHERCRNCTARIFTECASLPR